MKTLSTIPFLLFVNAFLYSQNHNVDSTRVYEIQEVIITKNETSKTEKTLKVKWMLKENEEFVTFVNNESKTNRNLKDVIFRIANLSLTKNKIIFIIYSNKDGMPDKEIYSQEISLLPKDEINKVSFKSENNYLLKDGVFIGFKFSKRDKDKGVYIFTETKKNPQTYIKKDNIWTRFQDENLFLPTNFRKIDLYLKIR